MPAQLKGHQRPQGQSWGAVGAGSLQISRPQPKVTLTDSQQGDVNEKVPYGGDHILAHLPFHFLRVQLRREALDAEHPGPATPTTSGALCSVLGPPRARNSAQPYFLFPPLIFARADRSLQGTKSFLTELFWRRMPEEGGRSLSNAGHGRLSPGCCFKILCLKLGTLYSKVVLQPLRGRCTEVPP